jgi:hypothetical protein
VVINHSEILAGLLAIDGAAFMLTIPMGFTFARFQLQRVLAEGRPWAALSALPRIMLPTFLFCLVHQLKGQTLYPSVLLFYNNFVDHYTDGGFNFWFIEVFVQLQLILFGLCAVPAFRRWVRVKPYTVSLALFIGGFAISRLMPLLWNTDRLHNLMPYRFIWYIALGWCIFFGTEKRQRLVNTALVAFLSAMQLPGWSEAFWVFFGGQMMVWAPTVRLPKVLAIATGAIASASLYIYLTHSLAFGASRILPLPYIEYIKIPIALIGGIVLGWVVDAAWGSARKLKSRSTQAAVGDSPP